MRRGVTTLLALTLTAPCAAPARADLKVRMPDVEFGEFEVEHNGLVIFGPKGSGFDRAQSYTNEVGYGVLPFWRIELEGELASGAGQHLAWEATTFENVFQLTEEGRYPINLGFFGEYAHSHKRRVADSLTFGPIIQKELTDFLGTDSLHTLNLFLSRDVGHGAAGGTGFQYAWQSVLLLSSYASPAVEAYGFVNDLGHSGHFRHQEHLVGPVLVGSARLPVLGKLRYEAGYLLGVTPASPRGAARWRLEYELRF